MQEGPYTGFDHYLAGRFLTLQEWQRLPQGTIAQVPAGTEGGFLVPDELQKFYITDTFGPNEEGHASVYAQSNVCEACSSLSFSF
jgi:hypothetical protein